MEMLTTKNLEIYKLLILYFKGTLLFLVFHDVKVRGQEKRSKECNGTDDIGHEQPPFEVTTLPVAKSINLVDVTKKNLFRYLGSEFAKSPWLSFGICSEVFQIVFWLSQVLLKLISEAEMYDEDQDGNRAIEGQRRSANPKLVLPLAKLFPCQSKPANLLLKKALFMT